jgi:hypothetical protein
MTAEHAMELTRQFREQHPARAAANLFMEGLVAEKWRLGPLTSRVDRERCRAFDDLGGYYWMLTDVLGDAFDTAPNVEEFVFGNLLKLVRTAIDLGKLTAPDGVVAREVHRERASARFYMLVQAVMAYLKASGLEPTASEKFASQIRPGLLDAMELPKNARAAGVEHPS